MMNNLGISTDPALLSVDMAESLNTSPSVSTFLPEEDASICPLLPATPSPPPLDFVHPLTPSPGPEKRDCNGQDGDNQGETSSSSGSSGIVVNANGTSSLFHPHIHNAYLHLTKDDEIIGTVDLNGTSTVQNGQFTVPITKDTPGFVSWNWPLIRKCTFLVFLAGLVAMVGMVIGMIIHLPKHCNPKVDWYRGGVIYEVFPASFQDSDGDGVGDLKGIANRVDYFDRLGVNAVRLNSIFPSEHFPDHFEDVTSLVDIAKQLGTERDFRELVYKMHSKNLSLVLDLPLYPLIKKLDPVYDALAPNQTERWSCDESNCIHRHVDERVNESNEVLNIMRFWLAKGVDGFYVKSLENFSDDPYLLANVRLWKNALGTDRILMVSSQVYDQMEADDAKDFSAHVDLVDVFVDIKNGSQYMAEQVDTIIKSKILGPGIGPWIHWSLGGVSERRLSQEMSPNASLAATLAQFMLPGTVNLFYGDEIALQESGTAFSAEGQDTTQLHHLAPMLFPNGFFTTPNALPWIAPASGATYSNFEIIQRMIKLRKSSPTIYLNAATKGMDNIVTTAVRFNKDNLYILERWYPRRNSFVSVSNFGNHKLTLDLSALFYSGTVKIGHAGDNDSQDGKKVLFSDFHIGPFETIITKLDK